MWQVVPGHRIGKMCRLFIAVLLLLLAGCSVKTGTEFDPGVADQIVIGKTTKKEVQALLGPPSNVTMM
jgi:outer membrane protein assembly factor BamE (lipoprotein component of BamABCDE complex)